MDLSKYIKSEVVELQRSAIHLAAYNPRIITKDMPYEVEEGCLSLTGMRKTVRYREITVTWQDLSFRKHTKKFSGWFAQILQHEIDHLDGIII